MSSEKFKKKQKQFYIYPEQLDRLNQLSETLGHPITELIEASIAFLLDCPPEFQERIYAYYHYCLARMFDTSQEKPSNNIQRLIDDAPPLGASKSTKPKPE